MKTRWNKMTSREKTIFLIDLLTILGASLLYALYYLHILDYAAAALSFCLFSFHFFITAFGKWKTDRDMAAYNIILGCFVLIGLLSLLMLTSKK